MLEGSMPHSVCESGTKLFYVCTTITFAILFPPLFFLNYDFFVHVFEAKMV